MIYMIFFFFFHNLDDPYYSGMRARVPNFLKANSKAVVASRIVDSNSNYISGNNISKLMKENGSAKKKSSALVAPMSTYHQQHLHHQQMHGNGGRDLYHHMPSQQQQQHQQQQQQYSMWHAKSYSHESGIGEWNIFN